MCILYLICFHVWSIKFEHWTVYSLKQWRECASKNDGMICNCLSTNTLSRLGHDILMGKKTRVFISETFLISHQSQQFCFKMSTGWMIIWPHEDVLWENNEDDLNMVQMHMGYHLGMTHFPNDLKQMATWYSNFKTIQNKRQASCKKFVFLDRQSLDCRNKKVGSLDLEFLQGP